jgi:hypothetical protein
MNRLELFKLHGKPSDEEPWCPQDITQMREAIAEVRDLTDLQLDALYSDFSGDAYAAQWLVLDVKNFRDWLFGEPYKDKFMSMYPPDWYPPAESRD